MDRETGRDTQETGPAEPGREAAVPEPGLPEPSRPESSRPAMTSTGADPRVPVWIRRAIMAVVAAAAVTIWKDWRWGLTAAVAVAVIDTIYQSKAMSPIPADARATSAQRRTRRRLLLLRPAGYLALHSRAIPGTDSAIDHLVIGPAGVFAVDSELWDRRLPVRATAGGPKASGVLYHGPFSQAPRLAHARWEAAQAARLIGAELGQELSVSPAMAIYGPTIPWGVATLRDVEVLGGRGVRRFFKRRNRATRGRHLDEQEIEAIYEAAGRALPPVR